MILAWNPGDTITYTAVITTGGASPASAGFQYWLDKLNQFDGNFERAEMVKAFIVSGEYRDRFPK